MDADPASRDGGRLSKLTELWRPLPWWERAIYLLTVIPVLLAFFMDELTKHLQAGWILNERLMEISTLLLFACFPFGVATIFLASRRWRPEEGRFLRQLWSLRAIVVGVSVLFALGAWETVIELATPPDRIAPNLPSFLTPLVYAAGGLVIAGVLLALPEVIVRLLRTTRRHL